MRTDEMLLTESEADAVVTAVRTLRKILANNQLELQNKDILHARLTSALYKLTDGAEGMIIPEVQVV